MKNTFKVSVLALAIAVSFAACKGKGAASTDSAKTDSAKVDSAKADSSKKDTGKMKMADTTAKKKM